MTAQTTLIAGISAFILLCAACIGVHLKPIMGKMHIAATVAEGPPRSDSPAAPSAVQEAIDQILARPGACFGPGTAGLTMEGRKRLDAIYPLLLRNASMHVEVRGFPDQPSGQPSQLGRRRAEAVRAYLVFHGIPEQRISSTGEMTVDGDAVPESRFILAVHSPLGE